MDLPIDDKELEVIIESVSDVDTELTRKLRLIQEVEIRTLAGLIKKYFVKNMEW